MIKEECAQLKKFFWVSLIITLPTIFYWLLGISDKLKAYLDAGHYSILILMYVNLFFYLVLPGAGFILLLNTHFRMMQIEKFKRHEATINKLKRFRNLLLLYFIALLAKSLVFLVFSI